MPTRLLSSAILRWPDRETVLASVQHWAEDLVARRVDVLRVGVFGSYARGDAGVGSDLDLVAVVRQSGVDFSYRAAAFDTTTLPVPCDLLVYTAKEWAEVSARGRFGEVLTEETIWLAER